MGSEMCIRDRSERRVDHGDPVTEPRAIAGDQLRCERDLGHEHDCCLLYTSDAADERSSVDLGGRRLIKKKKNFY